VGEAPVTMPSNSLPIRSPSSAGWVRLSGCSHSPPVRSDR
jgi:hypothetical protein